MSFLRGQSLLRGSFTFNVYVIGGRLLVHCTEGNFSLEVPLSEVLGILLLNVYILHH